MSLLDNPPHTATAYVRTRVDGGLGGSRDSFASVFTARGCWQQQATDKEVREFDKRGITVTDKVYFFELTNIDERHILEITNDRTGEARTFEVRSRAIPDASAGLGLVYRIMCEFTTIGSTSSA